MITPIDNEIRANHAFGRLRIPAWLNEDASNSESDLLIYCTSFLTRGMQLHEWKNGARLSQAEKASFCDADPFFSLSLFLSFLFETIIETVA